MGNMHLFHPPTGDKNIDTRLWPSPWPLVGSSGRNGIVLARIRQLNFPYHTNNKSIPISSIDTLNPLAGKVELATNTCRGEIGQPTRATLQSPVSLGPDIEEGAVS